MGRFPADGVAVAADVMGVMTGDASESVAVPAVADFLSAAAVSEDGDGSGDGVMTLAAFDGPEAAGVEDIGVARDWPAPNGATAVVDDDGVTETGSVPPPMAITPPHTEHRARTPVAGTLAGSTRNTDLQSGQDTVITLPLHCE